MSIGNDTFSLQLRPRYISGLTANIQKYYENETGVVYSTDAISRALEIWFENRLDRMLEGVGEVITSPHLAESQIFRETLEAQMGEVRSVPQSVPETSDEAVPESIFNGARPYSPQKLGAMIEYFAAKGSHIYKTNLNKLLFYGDLSFYYLYGRGISGATYLNLPYGPVPDSVEGVMDDLSQSGRIEKVDAPDHGPNAQMIRSADAAAAEAALDPDEMALLDWVLETYGSLSPGEISELSHDEKAYRFTRPQEPIAYEYAKFFKTLPPRPAGKRDS